jgi:hypothetical protein
MSRMVVFSGLRMTVRSKLIDRLHSAIDDEYNNPTFALARAGKDKSCLLFKTQKSSF